MYQQDIDPQGLEGRDRKLKDLGQSKIVGQTPESLVNGLVNPNEQQSLRMVLERERRRPSSRMLGGQIYFQME